MRSAITPGPEVTSAPLTFNLATWLHPMRIIELMPVIDVEDAQCCQSVILRRWIGESLHIFQVCPQLHSPAKEFFWVFLVMEW